MARNKIIEIKTDKVTHTAQDMWIHDLIGSPQDYDLFGFFAHFQRLFGGLSKNKGIHLSQREISEHMGVSVRTVKYKLLQLVELGILSYERKSTHPRAGGVYFINISKPHEFDSKAKAAIIKTAPVKPVEVQAEEVLEQTANFSRLCMELAEDASRQFSNLDEVVACRSLVYQGLLNEDFSVAQAMNAVRILKQQERVLTEATWNDAVHCPVRLNETQQHIAMLKQQELAGANE